MTLAVILPRFAHFGFLQAREARPQRRSPAAPGAKHCAMVREAILTLDNAPLDLRVLRGCIWITRDGCPVDFVLDAGETFEQRPGARVLVQALEDSEFLIAEATSSAQNA